MKEIKPAVASGAASAVRSAPLAGPLQIPFGVPAWLAGTLTYLALVILTRSFLYGNPLIHIDEQFYLFVAERMREGALPYVDIWDRKPVGLFLVYEVLAGLPGDPVVAYQLGATVAMVGTAALISRLAREIASPLAAWQAGAAYLLFLPIFNSGMGQAPVFYNLLVAMAAWGVIETVKRYEHEALLWRGCLIMLLLGLAIQIKYTVIFEGAAFGLILLSRGFADVWSYRRLAAVAVLWMGVALLPTLAAIACYAELGHLDAFIYANFVSIFERGSDGWQAPWRLIKEVAVLLPFWLAIFKAPKLFDTTGGAHPRSHAVLKLWGMAACAGFLIFGTWYDHYVAPLLVPLTILAAPALGRAVPSERWFGRGLLGLGLVGGLAVPIYQVGQHGTAAQFTQMNALIEQEMHQGCLFIYEGELAFYRTTHSCLPTTRIFPNHLNTYVEAKAIGMDPLTETRRVLDSHPDVIVMRSSEHRPYLPNLQTRRLMERRLAADYERYASYRLGNKTYWLFRPRPKG